MRSVVALVVAAAACAPPHVRQPIEEEPFVLSPGPPPSVREALARVARAESGRTSIERVGPGRRVPLVHATVGGQPTLMLLDTGAFDHVVEGWFVRQLQDSEATKTSAALVDHANRVVAVERWTDMTFAIDGWPPLAAIHPLTTGDVNPWPRALGIGGILSPQRLAGDSSVVIDFPANEMLLVDDAGGEARLASHSHSLGVALRCGAGYVFAGSVGGRDARLLLDTGATMTDLKASSAPGQALVGRSSVSRDIYAIGGAVGTRSLGDATVKVGDLSVKLDVAIVADRARASRCPNDGVLGMDVLTDCVVVVDAMKMRVSCG